LGPHAIPVVGSNVRVYGYNLNAAGSAIVAEQLLAQAGWSVPA